MKSMNMFKNLRQILDSQPISDFPLSDKTNQIILAVGANVRLLLDHPTGASNEVLLH
jgi:hypothetical protein